jgi:hypothetical protein
MVFVFLEKYLNNKKQQKEAVAKTVSFFFLPLPDKFAFRQNAFNVTITKWLETI